jgi:hypothetical protein
MLRLALSGPVCLCVLIVLLVPAPVSAQAPAPPEAPIPPVFRDRQLAAAGAAAQMVAVGDPWMVLAMRRGGLKNLVWSEYEIERVPPLNPRQLNAVQDNLPMPDLRAKAPDEIPQRDRDVYRVFCQALINARDTAPELFAREAHEDDNRGISAGQLLSQPGLYRGRVFHLEGRIARIERVIAPLPARDAGMNQFYEAWIVVNRVKNPVCVDFAIPPEGVKEGEAPGRHVSFDGYFFKRYLYKTENGTVLSTLLFIAPTLNTAGPPPEPASTDHLGLMFYIIGGVVAVTLLVVFALSVFFRRSDQKLRRRLSELRAARASDLGFAVDEPFVEDAIEPLPVEREKNGAGHDL